MARNTLGEGRLFFEIRRTARKIPFRNGTFRCFIFAIATFAVMLTATMVVKGYSDGVYSLESAAIEGR